MFNFCFLLIFQVCLFRLYSSFYRLSIKKKYFINLFDLVYLLWNIAITIKIKIKCKKITFFAVGVYIFDFIVCLGLFKFFPEVRNIPSIPMLAHAIAVQTSILHYMPILTSLIYMLYHKTKVIIKSWNVNLFLVDTSRFYPFWLCCYTTKVQVSGFHSYHNFYQHIFFYSTVI